MSDYFSDADAVRSMTDKQLQAIVSDFNHPKRNAADAELEARESDHWSRRTPAGGEA